MSDSTKPRHEWLVKSSLRRIHQFRRVTTDSALLLIEEHLGPLRDQLGLTPERLMAFGRENPENRNEEFCMTVLGLKTFQTRECCFRVARAGFACDVDRLVPGRPEEAVPIGHITNGVHVPSWLAPQMSKLYDRHFGRGLARA